CSHGHRRALLDVESRRRLSRRTSLIRRAWEERKMKRSSAPGHLQRVIEPDLERGAFVEPQIAIHKESRDCAGGCSNTSANGSTAPASSHCAADCAYTRACASSSYLVPFVHAAALTLPFLIRGL